MESMNADHDPILTVPVFLVDFCFVSVNGIKNSTLFSKWVTAVALDD
jgi:hypothetical protein